jgi:hypothetical protein
MRLTANTAPSGEMCCAEMPDQHRFVPGADLSRITRWYVQNGPGVRREHPGEELAAAADTDLLEDRLQVITHRVQRDERSADELRRLLLEAGLRPGGVRAPAGGAIRRRRRDWSGAALRSRPSCRVRPAFVVSDGSKSRDVWIGSESRGLDVSPSRGSGPRSGRTPMMGLWMR